MIELGLNSFGEVATNCSTLVQRVATQSALVLVLDVVIRSASREATHHRAQPGPLLLGDRQRLSAYPPLKAASHGYR